MALLPVSEALARLMAGTAPLEAEPVPIARAHGRVLAHDLIARRTQPPFAASAMDGYAVRSADTGDAPTRLAVIGSVVAGSVFDGTIGFKQAVRIFTGAPVPAGGDAIIIQEDVQTVDDGVIDVPSAVPRGRFVRPAGLDFTEGDTLLEAGRVLDGGALSLAASGNHGVLDVVRRPLVGILATGDELVPPGSDPGPGQIVASNSVGVAAIVREAGARVLDLEIARDTRASLSAKLDAAIAAHCDLLIVLGGASVGEHDLVRPAFADRGMELDFWRIAMRPGKPMMFGRLDNMRVLGLPGNPVSSLVCGHVFAAPLVAALSGRPHRQRRVRAVLGASLPANGPREHYMRARLTPTDGGVLAAEAFEDQDSSILRNFAHADGLIVRAPHAKALDAGAAVDVIFLPGRPMS